MPWVSVASRRVFVIGMLAGGLAVASEEKRDEAPPSSPRPQIVLVAEQQVAPSPVRFVMHRIGTFRSEACGVADFNNDGRLDIVAGPYIYLAPDWKAHKIRTLEGSVDDQGKGYYHDFMNQPLDVDGDGKLDVVGCHWWGVAEWFRNVGFDGQPWPRTIVEQDDKLNFECGDAWDIDGDGKANELLLHTAATWWYEVGTLADGKRGLIKHVVSSHRKDWGGGVGDLNGDGRPDILRPDAWYQAPPDPRTGTWIEHPLSVGGKDGKAEHTAQILVYDVNADGLADIIASSAHRYGIFWYQQIPSGTDSAGVSSAGKPAGVSSAASSTTSAPAPLHFRQHTIDDTWTQAHSLALADLDRDGDLDLVTGKRFMAHNGADPEESAPLGVYWYELKRGPKPTWTKHVISYGQGIGSGMNIPVVDLDGDGDLDIVVTGKWGGPVWFENRSR